MTGLEFVKSEFSIQNQRIDTLAYDRENNSFVIIEYKRNRNQSVFDQGVSYLNTLLKFKADFVLEYNEKLWKKLKRDEVDWSQSKVVFVSPSFSDVQKQAVDFKDLNIDLWEIKRFQNDIIVINGIRKTNSAPSFKDVSRNNVKPEILSEMQEIITYDEEYHVANKADEIIELYEDFKQAILNLSPDISIEVKKLYIAFKRNKRNIADIEIQKNQLRIYINAKIWMIVDMKEILKDVSKIWHWWNGDYMVVVKNSENLEYIMSLMKQIL